MKRKMSEQDLGVGEDDFSGGGDGFAVGSSDSFSDSQFQSYDVMGLVQRMKTTKFDRVQGVVGEILCGDMILVGLRAYDWKQNKLIESVLEEYESVFIKLGVVLAQEGQTDLALQDDTICYVCGQRSRKKRVPLSLRLGAANPIWDCYDAKAASSHCPVCCLPLESKEPSEKRAHGDEELFSCSVCWDDVPMDQTFALGCGHRFCNNCWKNYLEDRIKSPGSVDSVRSVCMEKDCKCPVPDSVFSQFVRDPKLLRRYVEQSVQQFVAAESHYKWCPYPGCDYAMYAESVKNVDPV